MSLIIENEKLARQIERIAEQEQRRPEEVVADAMQYYEEAVIERETTPTSMAVFLDAIAALGEADEDLSERDEEILAAELKS